MKKIYIIPALGETCAEKPYKQITKGLEKKGFIVAHINPNWYKPLSEQTFYIEPDAYIFGFSFGAVLAYLIATKYKCAKIVLASISPLHEFSYKSLVNDMLPYMSRTMAVLLALDVISIKMDQPIKAKAVRLAGALEVDKTADILVPKTGHKLSLSYIRTILEQI